MKQNITIAPSLLSADFSKVGEQLKELEESGTSWLHLDVMDGVFVPNISIGIPVISSLRKSSSLFFDTHLMITQPERYIEQFAKAGSDSITFHIEATECPAEVIKKIHDCGARAGISIKPHTPVSAIKEYLHDCDLVLVMTVEPGFGGQKFMSEMIPKISELVELRKECNLSYAIEVDGGVNSTTAVPCRNAGADILVAGSSVMGQPHVGEAYTSLMKSLRF